MVDAETKAPLEGVIVIALWELERPYSGEGPIPSGHMQVTEVLTDAQGHYVIPAWGPKERPKGSYMNNNDPQLVFFKPGYDFQTAENSFPGRMDDDRYEVMHNSKWSGKTIELEKFEGDLEAYYDRLIRLHDSLDAVFNRVLGAGDCSWLETPQIIIAFDK